MKKQAKQLPVLQETGIHPLVEQSDFTRLKHKLMNNDEGEPWSFEQCENGEREYKRFLTLVRFNPQKEIVPTKQMDKFWHQHILDTRTYLDDCIKVFGYFVHHFPYFGIYGEDDRANLNKEFKKTEELYLETFGESMDSEASRCENHPCHAPSECACRAAGTCKND